MSPRLHIPARLFDLHTPRKPAVLVISRSGKQRCLEGQDDSGGAGQAALHRNAAPSRAFSVPHAVVARHTLSFDARISPQSQRPQADALQHRSTAPLPACCTVD